MFLKELTEIDGVSGDEQRVRNFIIEKIKPMCSEITVDTMGNIIAMKKGRTNGKAKIMLCAHMDEVGFIVSDITDDGFVKFKTVGGIDSRILLAQRVAINSKNGRVPGVIGIKAVHLQSEEERKKVVAQDSMYIDIGASSKEDALKYISKGDYISFDSKYTEFGTDSIKAKALDDRAGCALLIELMRKEYECDLYFCFTVQEEVGTRGALIAARRINADAAIVFESTTAADIPNTEDYLRCTVQGEGPVLSIMDKASYSDKNLNNFVIKTAEKYNVNYQLKQTSNGGNDAGAIQTASYAVRTCSLSLPCRYIHSPVSTVRKCDVDSMCILAERILDEIHAFKIQ